MSLFIGNAGIQRPPPPDTPECASCDAGYTTCGMCLMAIQPSECPSVTGENGGDDNVINRDSGLAVGDLCEYDSGDDCSDGSFDIDPCGTFDVYRVVECHIPSPPSPPSLIGESADVHELWRPKPGSFVAASGDLVRDTLLTTCAVWGDVDNDGDADLVRT